MSVAGFSSRGFSGQRAAAAYYIPGTDAN
jgi:hypothetical protein